MRGVLPACPSYFLAPVARRLLMYRTASDQDKTWGFVGWKLKVVSVQERHGATEALNVACAFIYPGTGYTLPGRAELAKRRCLNI